MAQKTQIQAEEGKQYLVITRTFDLPLELLFKAYVDPEIVAQWMGTKVLKLESTAHGGYRFETTDPTGNKHLFNGAIHSCIPNHSIVRTFEMENTNFPVQIEYLTFEELAPKQSKLQMHIVYKSVTDRDNILKLPFAQGINMAHNRLQEYANTLK